MRITFDVFKDNTLFRKVVLIIDPCFHILRILSFLVQSFFETLQYCDEWRKFTSVSQSVSQSVSESVSQSVIV